jgi:hypothetical protein
MTNALSVYRFVLAIAYDLRAFSTTLERRTCRTIVIVTTNCYLSCSSMCFLMPHDTLGRLPVICPIELEERESWHLDCSWKSSGFYWCEPTEQKHKYGSCIPCGKRHQMRRSLRQGVRISCQKYWIVLSRQMLSAGNPAGTSRWKEIMTAWTLRWTRFQTGLTKKAFWRCPNHERNWSNVRLRTTSAPTLIKRQIRNTAVQFGTKEEIVNYWTTQEEGIAYRALFDMAIQGEKTRIKTVQA